MANGFKTRIGFISIAGLHCLPMWLYCLGFMESFLINQAFATFFASALLYFLFFGRFLCLSVEVTATHSF
jgi:hypothetical protein